MVEAYALSGSAKRDALVAIDADDKRAPIPALMQLAWGHFKALEGFPDLQHVYDLGQTHMPDVLGRLCAKAYSADGTRVAALRSQRPRDRASLHPGFGRSRDGGAPAMCPGLRPVRTSGSTIATPLPSTRGCRSPGHGVLHQTAWGRRKVETSRDASPTHLSHPSMG